ncbi:MAG: acyltransferase [Clostridia bacterium]|nr:acyltransferase [Clostridia bacterium]
MKKDKAISVTRVVAMLFIVLCHLFMFYGYNSLGQIFNVGVEVFLIISGFLYANKDIKDEKKFIKNRILKINIPLYILTTFILLIYVLNGKLRMLLFAPIYFLNLQGFDFLLPKSNFPVIQNITYLWFLTVIMLCYFLTVIIKRFDKKYNNSLYTDNKKLFKTFLLLIFVDVILAYLGFNFGYFLAYFLGYVLGKRNKEITLKKYLFATLTMLLAISIRLICKNTIDNTTLYNMVVVIFTHTALAYWIYQSIKFAEKYLKRLFSFIADSKIINWLDKHSMSIYLTHCLFLSDILSVKYFCDSIPIQMTLFFIFTALSAMLLSFLADNLSEVIKKH